MNQKNEIDAKEEERQELKLKLPSYEKRDSLRSSLSKVQKELKKYQNDILKPTKDRDDYQAKIKEAQAEIQKIESISDQSEEYYGKLSVLNQKKSTLSSTSSDLSDFSKKLVVFQNNVENCIELQKTYLEKYQSFQEIDRKYYESMSGIIAKEKLKESYKKFRKLQEELEENSKKILSTNENGKVVTEISIDEIITNKDRGMQDDI